MCKYLGGPEELIPSEVPTWRDVLRYVLFLQRYENAKSELTLSELAFIATEQAICTSSVSAATPPVR